MTTEKIENIAKSTAEARSFCGKILAQELSDRTLRNTNYSLRAFARDLSISSATLSNVIAGKQGLSRVLAKKIVTKLSLPQSYKQLFQEAASLASARSAKQRDIAKKAMHQLSREGEAELDIASFSIIQNPNHFAILESLKIAGVGRSSGQIADFLGIERLECEQCLDRLLAVGLVEKAGDGFTTSTNSTHTFPDGANGAVRNFHENLLRRGAQSLQRPVADRTVMNLITAVSRDDLDFVNTRINEFMRMLEYEIENRKAPKTDVYAIGFYSFSMKDGNTNV